ncbi:hypothetical protein, partial [Xanthomonas phaseoli]|uniref:hypothetical protein n=1 Tax=Xanthomonas phaseoli TaxID=1985254 RepID=UPI001ADCF3D2
PKTAKNRGSERGHRDRYGLPHPPIALFRPSLGHVITAHKNPDRRFPSIITKIFEVVSATHELKKAEPSL